MKSRRDGRELHRGSALRIRLMFANDAEAVPLLRIDWESHVAHPGGVWRA